MVDFSGLKVDFSGSWLKIQNDCVLHFRGFILAILLLKSHGRLFGLFSEMLHKLPKCDLKLRITSTHLFNLKAIKTHINDFIWLFEEHYPSS